MTDHFSDIEAALDFSKANEILTLWLGAEKVKPGNAQFEAIAKKTSSWVENVDSSGSALDGLAFVGRLWAMASWRAAKGALEWTERTASDLLDLVPEQTRIHDVAFWGGADERRFVSNALEVLNNDSAQNVIIILLASESARKSTKATTHHLDCLRRQNLTMSKIIEPTATIWRKIGRSKESSDTAALIRFENFVAALTSATWSDATIGSPVFSELPAAVRGPAQSTGSDMRDAAAAQFLELLSVYRLATPRRTDLALGYAPAIDLLAWFPGRRFPNTLSTTLEQALDDIERDLVWQLELGRRNGELRKIHEQLAGIEHSSTRLTKIAASPTLDEQASIWLRSGRWIELAHGDRDIAETAALELDPLIAELLVELSLVSAPRDNHLMDASRRADALARARGLARFGMIGSVIDFDPSRHDLVDDSVGKDNRVAIIRPGVVRDRASGTSVIVKARVRNAEF